MPRDRRGFLKGLTATAIPVRDPFGEILEAARSDGSEAAFESLILNLKAEKKYPLLFEARLMQKRHQMSLPLILTEPTAGLDPETQGEYEQATIAAAREVGEHFLADGDIIASWPYFRAIGENGSIAGAIKAIPADEAEDAVIEIAFYEGANPSKGFEMILARYGICRAITSFSQFPSADGQEESGRLLVRTLHSELLANLKSSVRRREGTAPATGSISELIAGRTSLASEADGTLDEGTRRQVDEVVRARFRPEFLNRVDEIILFHALGRRHLKKIAGMQLAALGRRLADRRVTVETTDAATDQLVAEGYDSAYGARPLRRTIQRRVLNPLAERLLKGGFGEGATVVVDADNGEFTFTVASQPAAG